MEINLADRNGLYLVLLGKKGRPICNFTYFADDQATFGVLGPEGSLMRSLVVYADPD